MSDNWGQLRDECNFGFHSLLVDIISVCLCLVEKEDAQNIYSEDNPKIILRGKELLQELPWVKF